MRLLATVWIAALLVACVGELGNGAAPGTATLASCPIDPEAEDDAACFCDVPEDLLCEEAW